MSAITLPDNATAEQVVRQFAESFKKFGASRISLYSHLIEHLDSGALEPLTKEEQQVVNLHKHFSPKAQQCFMNSQTLALADLSNQIKYHEGVIVSGELPIPLDHAWNSINGKIIDLTLAANNRRGKRLAKNANKEYKPHVYTYCGTTFTHREIQTAQLKTGRYCNVLPWVLNRVK